MLNSFLKVIAKTLVHLFCLFECILLGIIFSSAVFSVVMAVWSIISRIPVIIADRYWLVLLIASIPLTVVFFVIVELDLVKKDKYKDYLPKAKSE